MLKGEKVYLCEVDPDSNEWLRTQRNEPEMRQYFREWKDITIDMQNRWYQSRGNNTDPNHVYFEIHSNNPSGGGSLKPKELVGCTGLHYIDWVLRSAEFGIFLTKKAKGRGFGKEALQLLFDYGFREMNLHKIWCEVYDNNESIHLYRKLGFIDEGILRDNYFSDGKYRDSYRLSILEDEWFERTGGR